MGGNATKTNISKLSEKKYQKIKSILKTIYNTDIPRKIKKDFHGDIDVVGVLEPYQFEVKLIQKGFRILEKVKNDNITSYAVEFKFGFIFKKDIIFQLDYKQVNPDDFDFTYNIESYELNVFLGKILNEYDLKLSDTGLYLRLFFKNGKVVKRSGAVAKREFLITKDFNEVLKLLDLPYLGTLKTKKELYNYILSSKYFHKDIFNNIDTDRVNDFKNSKEFKKHKDFENLESKKGDFYVKNNYVYIKRVEMVSDYIDSYYKGTRNIKKFLNLEEVPKEFKNFLKDLSISSIKDLETAYNRFLNI